MGRRTGDVLVYTPFECTKVRHSISPRIFHTGCWVPKKGVLVVGGRPNPFSPLADGYLLSETGEVVSHTQDLFPEGRWHSFSCYSEALKGVLVCGGRNLESTFAQVFLISVQDDGSLRSQLLDWDLPVGLFNASINVLDGSVVVYGGLTEFGQASEHIYLRSPSHPFYMDIHALGPDQVRSLHTCVE